MKIALNKIFLVDYLSIRYQLVQYVLPIGGGPKPEIGDIFWTYETSPVRKRKLEFDLWCPLSVPPCLWDVSLAT